MKRKRTIQESTTTNPIGALNCDFAGLLSHFAAIYPKCKANGWDESNETSCDGFGELTTSEALDALANGWKGAPEVRRVEVPGLKSLAQNETYSYDVTGEILDIGAFTSGEPEHWMTQTTNELDTRKSIRITADIGASAYVSAKALSTRGQAIVALVHALELRGHSVVLTVACVVTNHNGIEQSLSVVAKQAGEALNINRLQLLLSSSFFRRLVFMHMRHATNDGRIMYKTGSKSSRVAGEADIHLERVDALTEDLDAALVIVAALVAAN